MSDPETDPRAALEARRQALGPEHPALVPLLLDAAEAADRQGDDPAEAAPLLREALALEERHFGPSPRLALILHRLAGLLWTGHPHLEEATGHALRAADLVTLADPTDRLVDPVALADLLRHLADRHAWRATVRADDEPDHPGTAEAERIYRRALAFQEATLDPHDKEIGYTLDALEKLLQKQGRTAETEPLLRRQQAIYAHAFGPNDGFVADALDALAALYREQGRLDEAEEAALQAVAIHEHNAAYRKLDAGYGRLVEIRTQRLGPAHPDVHAMTLRHADALYRYAEAERREHRDHNAVPAYREALKRQEQHLGKHDPAVAATLFGLAETHAYEGRYDQAVPPYKRAFKIWEQALEAAGPEDRPALLARLDETARQLEDACASAERFAPSEAAPFLERLARYRPADPALDTALAELAAFHAREAGQDYSTQEELAAAEAAFARVLTLQRERLGPGHPEVAETLHAFLRFYLRQGRSGDARPLLDRLVGIERARLREDAPALGAWFDEMGDLFRQYGRSEEAVGLYTDALDCYRAAYGDDDAETDAVREKLYALMY